MLQMQSSLSITFYMHTDTDEQIFAALRGPKMAGQIGTLLYIG